MALITKKSDQVNNQTDAPKIEFPCDNYLIKVVALDVEGGHVDIVSCMKSHDPKMDTDTMGINRSSKGRFVSYSFRIVARSEEHLSQLHGDLMAIHSVKMVM